MGQPIPRMRKAKQHLFVLLGEMAYRLGVRDAVKRRGCWERQIAPKWWVALNPHQEPCECSRGSTVPPVTWYVEYNGWPAGMIDLRGWSLAAGACANEESFRAAVEAAT